MDSALVDASRRLLSEVTLVSVGSLEFSCLILLAGGIIFV